MLSLVLVLGESHCDPLSESITLKAPLGFQPGHLPWEPFLEELVFEALSAFSSGEENVHSSGCPFVNDFRQRARGSISSSQSGMYFVGSYSKAPLDVSHTNSG